MGKEDFVNLLGKEGIIAAEENSVVMIHCEGEIKEAETILSRVSELAKENGFSSSFGIRYKNNAPQEQQNTEAVIENQSIFDFNNEESMFQDFEQLSFIQ